MSKATARLRAAVCARAEGNCEACGAWVGLDGEHGHLDHEFGRAKVRESVSNCWLLCVRCDEAKTNNRAPKDFKGPGAAYWLEKFIRHCDWYGFTTEQLRAESRLVFVQARAGLVVRGCDV